MTGVLVLAPRVTESGLACADAARRRGMRVETLREWRVPGDLAEAQGVHLYAGPLFADAVGAELGLGLLEPDGDWLARLPREVVRREIAFTTLERARGLRRAAFVKPPEDKSFPARVYPDGAALPGPDVADGDLPVLVSDIVLFLAEFRLFVLDGAVVTATRYAVAGEVDAAGDDPRCAEAIDFAAALLAPGMPALPSAVVVDVGLIADPRTGRPEWAVIEANAAWASGHYAADPDLALETVLRSGGPRAAVLPADERYLRTLPEVVH
ncbi:ATP-grasp domain-containing protein [Catellatospora sp. KI3]|uniref:ATP-grasp domain-containing protein n=1 Tax=Catellatospora sp. KI3 TaxID=3041620 RepID=UPI00248259E2|nr:ATP-grasp domain-containing protein [Catellatospora sp. KI3]MDI1462029.1 ATP-grasp domain-containing protein [Catellatospora sp. KI3]